MEKYIKAAAAVISIGALGYLGYRVATKQTNVSVRINTQPAPQAPMAESVEKRSEGGGLDHINKTHYEILWRRAGVSQNVRREGVLGDGVVYARLNGKLFSVAMTGGKLSRGIQINPGANGADHAVLIDSSSDPVTVAGAISSLMFQTTA